MDYKVYILFIPLLPLASFALLGLFSKRLPHSISGALASLLMLAVTVLSVYTAGNYFFVEGPANGAYPTLLPVNFEWLRFSDTLTIRMGVLLDPISVMMLVVVSFVSLMVHVFSLGYMKGEERFTTYYAFLGLFTFSMLGLVLSSNLFQIYIFWELVGVSSYLLIGFYYDRPSAVAASKKAFVVTRFADLGFLVGILILAYFGDTLDFGLLLERLTQPQSPQFLAITTATFAGFTALTWGLVLVFVGGAGKSAMFPLHIWLPDAMEGPTPVSALIHAATMVVAGVYLVARLFPLFFINHASLQVVTWIGVISALLAAIIACTQTDIKRVLAYSTISQIGYMMFALGVSGSGGTEGLGYTASMFHLFTHAFFKSLLFLGAGAVIHYVHSNEMKDMGGLRKYLPITHITFLVGCLAIAGVPPLSGFFSKEEILLAAYTANKAVYGLALFTAGLTAFYMFRLYFSIFWNKLYTPEHHHGEGDFSMKLPLVLLAICAVIAGFVPFGQYVTSDRIPHENELHLIFSIAPVLLTLLGIVVAGWLYKTESGRVSKWISSAGNLYKLAYKKFYFDELYLFFTRRIIFPLIGAPAAWVDKHIVDGMMNGIAGITAGVSSAIKGLQSGKVQQYALYFFGGIVVLTLIFLYLWK